MNTTPLTPVQGETTGEHSPQPASPACVRAPAVARGMRRSFAWTLAGNSVYAICQWLTVVILARLGTVDMLGQFALGLALATPLTLAANLYLRAVLAADVRGKYAFADYLGLRLLTTLLAMCVIAAVALSGIFRGATIWVLLIVGAGKALDAVSDLYMGLLQLRGRLDALAWGLAINGAVSLLALTLLLWWTRDIVWASLGAALGSAAALCLLWWTARAEGSRAALARLFHPRAHAPALRALAVSATPLGIASLRSVLSLNVPRYVIAFALGEHALGIFAALAALVVAGLVVTTALTTALASRLAAHYALGERLAFRALILRLLQLGVAQCVLGVTLALVAGQALLALIFNAEYAQYQTVLVWLSLTAAAYAITSFLETALTAMGRFTVQMQIQLVTLALLVGLCFWLTPRYGLAGAAAAMFGSALLAAVGYALALSHHFDQRFNVCAVWPER